MSNELAQMILAVVSQIPKGKVASYGQIAKLAGLPKHARLVGRVLGQIEDRTAIPWHRVINSQGKMSTTQLTEHGDHLQQILLLSEGVVVINGRVNLKQFAWLP
ncbi:MGMT family protein [Acinetobacter sp. TY2]|uniref:MGMT family protein n=1 Tax=Acinetobacter sp. TY2 TaxID=3387403 RepID=UPI0039176F71